MNATEIFRAVAGYKAKAPAWAPGVKIGVEAVLTRHAPPPDFEVTAMKGLGLAMKFGRVIIGADAIRDACDPYDECLTVDRMLPLIDRAITEACRMAGYRPPTPEHAKRWRKARMERMLRRRR